MAASVYILEVFKFYIIILSQVIDFFYIWHDQRIRVEVDILISYSQIYSCRQVIIFCSCGEDFVSYIVSLVTEKNYLWYC
jgi:hypothetical protein